jgi:hypothetical protein
MARILARATCSSLAKTISEATTTSTLQRRDYLRKIVFIKVLASRMERILARATCSSLAKTMSEVTTTSTLHRRDYLSKSVLID